MRAFLLAAGLGTRLRPLTDHVPKCMVPVRGRPLIDYWLELLFDAGIERVLINTHHLADVVRAHVGASPWRDRIDLVHEPALLGTGGSVAANRGWCQGRAILVAHADNLTDLDVSALLAAHAARPPRCAMTMMAFQTDDPHSCGILELDDAGLVKAFHEKVADPPGDLANAAVYVFEPEVVEAAAGIGKAEVDLSTEVIPMFLGRILAFRWPGYHRDIGSPDSLRIANATFPGAPPA